MLTDVFIPGLKPQESLAQILLLMSKKEQAEKCQLGKQIREHCRVRAQDFPRGKRSVPLCAKAELDSSNGCGSTFSLASSLHCGGALQSGHQPWTGPGWTSEAVQKLKTSKHWNLAGK